MGIPPTSGCSPWPYIRIFVVDCFGCTLPVLSDASRQGTVLQVERLGPGVPVDQGSGIPDDERKLGGDRPSVTATQRHPRMPWGYCGGARRNPQDSHAEKSAKIVTTTKMTTVKTAAAAPAKIQ